MQINVDEDKINEMIQMIGAMASLNFSKRIETEITDNPIDVLAYGLNMLSEELEYNVVKKSMLEETNRSLERFSFTVAHDIKSPLSSAYTLMTLIEAELEGNNNETLREYIDLLKKINEQTREMVNGILDYSRANYNSIKQEDVDLSLFLNQIAEEYRLSDKVTFILPPHLPTIRFNKLALKQIFSNLINNAIKHNNKAQCHISIECTPKEDFYEIAVTDNGPGIPERDKERVFDLFENLKTTLEDSHGIGLSIVKKLVTQANGNIWVDVANTNGARFVFTIEK